MFEKRRDFFKVIESKLSSTNLLLSKPEKLKSELNEFEVLLKEYWPSIFASLNESPLNEDEIKVLQTLLKTIENLNKACPNHLGDWYFTGEYPVKIIDELGEEKVTQLSLLSTGSNN